MAAGVIGGAVGQGRRSSVVVVVAGTDARCRESASDCRTGAGVLAGRNRRRNRDGCRVAADLRLVVVAGGGGLFAVGVAGVPRHGAASAGARWLVGRSGPHSEPGASRGSGIRTADANGAVGPRTGAWAGEMDGTALCWRARSFIVIGADPSRTHIRGSARRTPPACRHDVETTATIRRRIGSSSPRAHPRALAPPGGSARGCGSGGLPAMGNESAAEKSTNANRQIGASRGSPPSRCVSDTPPADVPIGCTRQSGRYHAYRLNGGTLA